LARGYNVLIFDGPGQQSMLYERGIGFRSDWEAVLTPIVDLLLTREDVDPDRLALYGVSQGGFWVPRTVAYEHRFAAAIADPGVKNVSDMSPPRSPEVAVPGREEGRLRPGHDPRHALLVPEPADVEL